MWGTGLGLCGSKALSMWGRAWGHVGSGRVWGGSGLCGGEEAEGRIPPTPHATAAPIRSQAPCQHTTPGRGPTIPHPSPQAPGSTPTLPPKPCSHTMPGSALSEPCAVPYDDVT